MPPAPERNGNRAAHAAVQTHEVNESLLDHPVDCELRTLRAKIVHDRQGVHVVAERRRSHDENAGPAADGLRLGLHVELAALLAGEKP